MEDQERQDQLEAMAAYLEQKRAGPWELAARISIPLVGILVVLVLLQLTIGAAQNSRIDRLEANDKTHTKIEKELTSAQTEHIEEDHKP